MRVSQATSADVDALMQLDSEVSTNAPGSTRIEKWVQEGSCHVAELDHRAAGYGVLTHNFFENGMIEVVIVGRGFRRKGVGTALIEHFKKICRTEKLFASTNLSNRPMQALLTKSGFRLSGFIDNLDEGDPELVFMTSIPQGLH